MPRNIAIPFNARIIGLALGGGGISGGVAAFTPTQLTGLKLWLKADTGAGASDNDVVTTWTDQSGNGNSPTQGTAANRPIYKTNIINGNPVVRFDGSNDALRTVSIAHGIGTGDFYIAVVLVPRDQTGTAGTYRAILGNGVSLPGLFNRGAGNFVEYFWNSSHVFAGTVVTGTPYLLEFWRASGVVKLAINGIQDATTFSDSTSMSNAVFEVGAQGDGTTNGQNDIGELVFCNTFPSTSITALRTYFTGRWAVP